MLGNVLCALFSTVASVLIYVHGRDYRGRVFFLFLAGGFAFLTYHFATIGRNLPYLAGMGALFIGTVGMAIASYER